MRNWRKKKKLIKFISDLVTELHLYFKQFAHGVANNADNAEEEAVTAGAAVQAVQNATEEASTKDAEVDTIAAKATVSGGVESRST